MRGHSGPRPVNENEPTMATVTGLIDAGLLVWSEDGTAALADEVRCGLRPTDSDDTRPYWI